jgi:hypothetical protein
MYADERLKAEIIQEAMAKSGEAIRPEADGAVCIRTPGDLYPSGLLALCCQRMLLPLQALTESDVVRHGVLVL